MAKTTTLLWAIAGVLFLALAGVAAYKALPILNPEVGGMAPLDTDCDLRAGACRSDLPGGGQISFAIKTPGIPLVKPLDLEVRLSGVEASKVEVDFVGIGMNMGFNRPRLDARGDGVFAGTGMLPVCVRVAMEWEARVLITSPRGLLAAPFRFITVKDGVVLPGGER
ncbi:hypothetical protein [Sedimenticola hydrogenitrophicus]|uniref:hypothetical protein n=1 Tax=Sedimenticola hydrogenitrophicus TaxID=2967975 RepID=UPI0021A72376